ncbi:omega-hydroxypalmitate O-feruloyl transferase [Apostasia shenzhenica]|uniref:Omega-hydroxypalmitate O-feruloyl transferase n=1 Tax=Apostasia shenzhenica TaxID=1088818 RepID=A0A2I0AI79_9ASPA|nr:omega-hydroxypalmitate O-feruloyl transferase [Apostasia shenzhenica]
MGSEPAEEDDRQESSKEASHVVGRGAAAAEGSGLRSEQVVPTGSEKKRRGRKRNEDKEADRGEVKKRKVAPKTSTVDRPSRERKSVVRYATLSPRRMSAVKAVAIGQGRGEKLKDIPNVAFKVSKRKADDSLRALHSILFGRKANAHFLKRNILQFSGLVYSEDEEKHRSRVKEKLNKCNKDRLLEFCDLLDIYTLKVTTKKEEISEKLLEFLESPQATRDVLLSDKGKGGKRKWGARGAGQAPPVEKTSDKETEQKRKKVAKIVIRRSVKTDKEDQEDVSSDKVDESTDEDKNVDEADSVGRPKSEAEEEEDEYEYRESNKTLSDGEETDEHKDPEKASSSSAPKKKNKDEIKRSSKNRKEKAANKKESLDKSERKAPLKKAETGHSTYVSNRSSMKDDNKKGKGNVKISSKDVKGSKNHVEKEKSKKAGKKQGKDKDISVGPTTEQLHVEVARILKEVDFNTATLADIIRQLGARFKTDLMNRKAEIKRVIEEVINNMTDDEDEDGVGGDNGDEDEK